LIGWVYGFEGGADVRFLTAFLRVQKKNFAAFFEPDFLALKGGG
jgi:hypothetical protein